MRSLLAAVLCAAVALVSAAGAQAAAGTSFPPGFAVPVDTSLGVPVLGFGGAGPVTRTPVVLLHGNNDTPYPTLCNPYGAVSQLASFLLDNGYAPSEVWALGYQGDQCDLLTTPTNRSGVAHSTVANVPDLRNFVHAVLEYTGAKRVDIVGHSLGVTLARAWMREDHANQLVRRLVAIDGPNHGIVDCSPDPANYWQLPALGGFTPDSAICREYGAADTPFLSWLNHGTETPGPTRYLAIRLLLHAGRADRARPRRGPHGSAARLLAERAPGRSAGPERGRDRAGSVRPVPRDGASRHPRLAAGLATDARLPHGAERRCRRPGPLGSRPVMLPSFWVASTKRCKDAGSAHSHCYGRD
jgi:pimeloyl-ACP methyl ester carboxylesterase